MVFTNSLSLHPSLAASSLRAATARVAPFLLPCVVGLSFVAISSAQNNVFNFPTTSIVNALAVGDVDKDGLPDILACSFFDGASRNGHVRLWSGKDGRVMQSWVGASFEAIGWSGDLVDMNGDGTLDILIGNPWAGTSGDVRCYSGVDYKLLFTISGDKLGDNFGRSVRSAGDINRDSIPDLIIGAWLGGANGEGYVKVFSGKDIADKAKRQQMAHIDGPKDGLANQSSRFGIAVAGVGDVDNDGFTDIMVGAHQTVAPNSMDMDGAAYVYSGRWVFLQKGNPLIHTLKGASGVGGSFGLSLTGLGDINADGHADFTVSEVFWSPVKTPLLQIGRVLVYSGKDAQVLHTMTGHRHFGGWGTSLQAGDIDGDKVQDLILGEGLAGSGLHVYSGAELAKGNSKSILDIGGLFGAPAIPGLGFASGFYGDMNKDGVTDVVAGHNNGVLVASSKPVALSTDASVLSVGRNNVVEFHINLGPKNAVTPYLLVGSLSGTTPGITVNGVKIPLNPDVMSSFTIVAANTQNLENFSGVTDVAGSAKAKFWTQSSTTPPALIGTNMWFAALQIRAGNLVGVTNPVMLRLEK